MSYLDPKELFVAYQEKNLHKDSAIGYLRAFIEDCDDDKKRINAIYFITKIDTDANDKISRILKYSLLSDQSSLVRSFVARILVTTRLIQNHNLIEFVINNDASVLVITTIFKSLEKIKTNLSKDLQKKIILKYAELHHVIPKEAKFLVDLYRLAIRIHGDFNVDRTFINNSVSNYYLEYDPRCDPIDEFVPTPSIIVQKGHIKVIDLLCWDLYKLPKSIYTLKKIKYLTFSASCFTKFPKSLNKLKHLKWVEIAGIPKNRNYPNFIPEWVWDLAKRYHAKTYIKDGVRPDEANILGLLDLILYTKIQKYEDYDYIDDPYSDNICAYRQNKKGHVIGLYIFSNARKLTILPEQIGELKWLIDLDFHNNEIKIIPESFGLLTSLKYLDLSYNKIQTIPGSMAYLKSLEYTNFYGNNINIMPKMIRDLDSRSRGSGHYFWEEN